MECPKQKRVRTGVKLALFRLSLAVCPLLGSLHKAFSPAPSGTGCERTSSVLIGHSLGSPPDDTGALRHGRAARWLPARAHALPSCSTQVLPEQSPHSGTMRLDYSSSSAAKRGWMSRRSRRRCRGGGKRPVRCGECWYRDRWLAAIIDRRPPDSAVRTLRRLAPAARPGQRASARRGPGGARWSRYRRRR